MSREPLIISHWSTLIENLQCSPKDFYTKLEEAIRKRQVPEVELSRVDGREGGFLSASREYLRITRKDLVFDICAAPFGTGFFFSSWLTVKPESGCLRLFLILTIIGMVVFLFPRRLTYYQFDTMKMFQASIHNSVLEVIDLITKVKGIRALSELERKPIMRELVRG